MKPSLTLAVDGAEHWPSAALAHVPAILDAVADCPIYRAGTRLTGNTPLRQLVDRDGPIGSRIAARLGAATRPVRMIFFDKSAETNWALGWHQDRTIVVRQRINVAGFGPWTVKAGLQHVAPPVAVLEQMMTIRIHLDAVPADNAPLLIAPGSHRLGRVAGTYIAAAVEQFGVHACLAELGDIWSYSTPILHSSGAAIGPRRRRVLQVDYAAADLPGGLEWLGV